MRFDIDGIGKVQGIAVPSDLENLMAKIKSIVSKSFKTLPWKAISELENDVDWGRKIFQGQVRHGARTLGEILDADRSLSDEANDVLRRSPISDKLLSAGVREEDIVWSALANVCKEELSVETQAQQLEEVWYSKPYLSEWVMAEILSRGHWMDREDSFMVMDASGPFSGSYFRGSKLTLDKLEGIIGDNIKHIQAANPWVTYSQQGRRSVKYVPMGETEVKREATATLYRHLEAKLDAVRKEIAYTPEAGAKDLTKELFVNLFLHKWKLKGHEAITNPGIYADTKEGMEKKAEDMVRLRCHLTMLRHWLLLAKKAFYNLLNENDAGLRILPVIYGREGDLGKTFFCRMLMAKFSSVRECAEVDFKETVEGTFNTDIFTKAALFVDELDLGDENQHSSKIKSVITGASITSRDAYARASTKKFAHASIIATANSPLSVILMTDKGSGVDAGQKRRFWEYELMAPDRRGGTLDIENYDFIALWKSIDENTAVLPTQALSEEEKTMFKQMQGEFVNSSWFDQYVDRLSMHRPKDDDDRIAIVCSALDDYMLKKLQSENLVSQKMTTASIHRLMERWLSATHLQRGKNISKDLNVLIISRSQAHPDILKSKYVLGGNTLIGEDEFLLKGLVNPIAPIKAG